MKSTKIINDPTFFSKVFKVIKNPFFIIGFILLTAVVILVLTDKSQSKVAPVNACSDTQTLCGTKCIDNDKSKCTHDAKVCDITQYCPDPLGDTCCETNSLCNPLTNKCEVCPSDHKICAGRCCTTSTEDCTSDKQYCCEKSNITSDGSCCTEIEGGSICKSSTTGTTKCCSFKNGEVCDKNTGQCVQGCPDINNLKNYKCSDDSTVPPLPLSSKLCGLNQICTADCSKQGQDRFVCADKSACNWSPIEYNPNYLIKNSVEGDYKFNNNLVAQCSDDKNTTWIKYDSKIGTSLLATANTNSTTSNTECTFPMCVDRIQQYDTENIKRDFTKETDYSCSSNLNCKMSLFPDTQIGKNNVNSVCSDIANKGKFSKDLERCCKNSTGDYTGQVCELDQFCDYNQTCNYGFKFDGKQCKPSKNKNDIMTFDNCLLNNCPGKTCDDWRSCYCCPNYQDCVNCQYTYEMFNPDDNAVCDFDAARLYYKKLNKEDNMVFIYVPSGLKLTTDDKDSTSLNYYATKEQQPCKIYKKDYPKLKFDLDQYIFASEQLDSINFKFTLDSNQYTVNNKIGGVFDGRWELTLSDDNGNSCVATSNSQGTETRDCIVNYVGEQMNAYIQIGDTNNHKPTKIFIAPRSPDNSKYLKQSGSSCPSACSGSGCPNILPTLPPTPTLLPTLLPTLPPTPTNHKSNFSINLLIFLLILIIILISYYICFF